MISEIDALMDEPFVLLMDNVRCHSDPPDLNEGHQIRFLPKYSPYLNAAEMAGSCVKAAAKRRLSDPIIQVELQTAEPGLTLHRHPMNVLMREVQESLQEITREKCLRWYNHTFQYFNKCLNFEDIDD